MDPERLDHLAQRAAERRIGTWIRGKYQLDSILGEGGMAVVYAATHRNKKRFAVKMLRGELTTADEIRRFLREGYVANTVNHPGAVAVIDDDVAEDGSAFLVMDLLQGESVEALWERSGARLPPRTVLAMAHQLMDVLAAAHAKDVVHRDIKPANLFMTRDEKVKVLDFGIARLREAHDSTSSTRTGVSMGTPAFMPPEQARGKLSQISPLTDVWAAGATMFTLVSGAQVHEGESSQEIMHNSATVPARSLASVATDVPVELVRIVDRALAFAPADRWPSAAAMRDAIAEAHLQLFGVALVSEPTLPSNDVDVSISSQRSGRFLATEISQNRAVSSVEALISAVGQASPRRTKTLVLGGVALALVLAIAGTVSVARSRNPAESRTPVVAAEPPPVAVVAATAAPVIVATAVVPPPSPTPSTREVASIPTAKAAARPISNSRPSPKPAARPNDWDHQ